MEVRLASKSAKSAETTATHPEAVTTAKPGSANFAIRHKYRAKPITLDGIRFASQAEGKRYLELKALEASGEITHLELQPKYTIVINGVKVCTYIADFRYRTKTNAVVEDVKGMLTPVYRLKKKMVEAMFPGTAITEIGRSSTRKSRKSKSPTGCKKGRSPSK